MPAGHVQQIVILIFPPPETCHLRPAFLLLSSEPHPCAIDSRDRFFVICEYTGKEVVGCKVQIVTVIPDQVRWLRLRAVALILREFLRTLSSGKSGTSLATIRAYGLIHPSQAMPGTGKSGG